MNYYNDEQEQRNERNWNIFKNTVLILAITALTIGYFTIDFTKFDNIKTEQTK